MSGIELTGFDEVSNALKELQEKATRMSGTREVNIIELFTDDFMLEHTSYRTFANFVDNFKNDMTNDEFKSILSTAEWNQYVANNSQFNDWADMQENAVGQYYAKQLGF